VSSPVTPTNPTIPAALREITNKEKSPASHTLKSMTSKLSLSARKKSLTGKKTEPEIDENAFPASPNQEFLHSPIAKKLLHDIAEEREIESSPSGLYEKRTNFAGSISKRRGFRPLSIHTGKAFDPFGVPANGKNEASKETQIVSPLENKTTRRDNFITLRSCTRK